MKCQQVGTVLSVFLLVVLTASFGEAGTYPMVVTDAVGHEIQIIRKPSRVVCLAAYVTDMLTAFGQEQVIVGLSRQDMLNNSALRVENLGGYFNPNIEAIDRCRPDLIIAAPSHEQVLSRFGKQDIPVLVLKAGHLEEAFDHMALIGRIFDCEAEAAEVIARNTEQMALVKARLAGLKNDERKRVARVMVGKSMTCPGDDSFQVEMISTAGGISLLPGQNSFAAPVTLDQWRQFDPQVIYGCGLNETAVRSAVQRKGWNTVTAVRTGFVTMFPCELTCRASVRTGAFVQWLAAVLYPELMADTQKAVLQNAVLEQSTLSVNLPYVAEVCKVRHRVADAEFKSLCIKFAQPLEILSTLEGWRTGVMGVGNTHTPMHASLGHMANGIAGVQKAIADNLGFEPQAFAGLMTGADMDNLSVQERQAGDLRVIAFVTAGVRGNALRLSKDTAGFVKHGTINIVLLTNRRLSPQAMSWAVVTITEAKSAALSDLDIRSTYTPRRHGATGTGTDTVIVVQGAGEAANSSSGHTKLGELIAKAVHAGVTEAISKQNGIHADRPLLQRLAERKLRVGDIVRLYADHAGITLSPAALEKVLMSPASAGFIESALAISDAHGKGLIKDLSFFDQQCALVTTRLSGRTDTATIDADIPELTPVLSRAFGALVAGITQKQE